MPINNTAVALASEAARDRLLTTLRNVTTTADGILGDGNWSTIPFGVDADDEKVPLDPFASSRPMRQTSRALIDSLCYLRPADADHFHEICPSSTEEVTADA
jgi:hypothetical protein